MEDDTDAIRQALRMIVEADRDLPSGSIKQGDILRPANTNAVAPGLAGLLVLTADCDIQHAKHNQRLTCIPIYGWLQYVEHVYVYALVNTKRFKAEKSARDLLSRENLDTQVLDELLAAPDLPNSQLHSLSSVNKNEIIKAVELIGRASAVLRLDPASLWSAPAVEALFGQAPLEAIGKLLDQHIKQPPGDVFPLESATDGTAYFAYLRDIYNVSPSQVATTTRSHSAALYRRSSRLSDRYLFALTRKLGDVFGSVGTPRESEDSVRISNATRIACAGHIERIRNQS